MGDSLSQLPRPYVTSDYWNRETDQTVTKGLSSSSKFSGSCVPTLQTLPWLVPVLVPFGAEMRGGYEMKRDGMSRKQTTWRL